MSITNWFYRNVIQKAFARMGDMTNEEVCAIGTSPVSVFVDTILAETERRTGRKMTPEDLMQVAQRQSDVGHELYKRAEAEAIRLGLKVRPEDKDIN